MAEGMAVGMVIREARRRAGLSLEDLATRAACARSHLSQVETGKKHAGEELLGRIEEGLGLPAGMLVERAGLGRAPEAVRRRVSDLEARTAAAKRLAGILRQSGIGEDGRLRGSLDVAHRTGELRRLVAQIAPELAGPEDRTGDVARLDAGAPSARGKGATPGGRAKRGPAAKRGAEGRLATVPVSEAMPRLIPLINRVAAGALSDFTDLGYPARVADEYIRSKDLEDEDALEVLLIVELLYAV
jgi:transcriptional regulator with XRE-family HTH domain